MDAQRMLSTPLRLAGALAGLALLGCRSQPTAPPTPDAYLEAATREATEFAGGQADVEEAQGAPLPNGRGYIVCGTLVADGEKLPFATAWDAGEDLGRGATVVGLGKAHARQSRNGYASHKAIGGLCEAAGLSEALPR